MTTMRITTTPVYSLLASDQDVPPEIRAKLPPGWKPSSHQLATYEALKDDSLDVVFNTAMTGDGKSLAGQLPTLVEDYPRTLLAMYPTNELVRDQLRQTAQTLRLWERNDLRPTQLDAARLDALVEEVDIERKDALKNLWDNHDLVLTNPDIFHYVMQQYYIRTGKKGDAPDLVINALLQDFNQFTFDEFHIFQAPQIVSVVNALIFIHEVVGKIQPKKFLFLSATPEDALLNYLDRAEFSYIQIQGKYTHAWKNDDPSCWRRILHGSTIHFVPQQAEAWVAAHYEDTLLPFFQNHRPAAKGAIIVNSVASAQRLVRKLKPLFAEHQITVQSNTGFDASGTRRASYEADLLIGTSTIDVGVDFQINFLVFESRDAGTFRQRLGRLGRHDGFERNGTSHKFEAFEAHALLPSWIHERLFQAETGSTPPLSEGLEIDREHLSCVIREAFPSVTSFERYGQMWGGLQAAQVIRGLYHKTIKANYSGTREKLAERYKKTLQVPIGRKISDLLELEKTTPAILEEARSFRGGRDLHCGILDLSEAGAAQVKTYDLFGLISNFELAPLEKDEFFSEVELHQLSSRAYDPKNLIAYFRVLGVRPERNDVHVKFNEDIDNWESHEFGIAQVIRHIELDAAQVPEFSRLNKALRRRNLVALLCLLRPFELAQRLRLPFPFPIHRFISKDGCQGSIAFGRQALMLEVALCARPDIKCGGRDKAVII